MARTDIFKRIKNDKLIESRIQKYRLHYDYLKTCLDFPNDFKVDKSKYIHWKLISRLSQFCLIFYNLQLCAYSLK